MADDRDILKTLDNEQDPRQVVHSDTITDAEDVVLLAKAQRRLLYIAAGAGLFILLVSVGFFSGLHDESYVETTPTVAKAAEYRQGSYGAVATESGSQLVSYLKDQNQSTIIAEVSAVTQQQPNKNSSLQISQDTQTIAYLTSDGATNTLNVKRGDAEPVQIVSVATGNFYDWLLSQNGDYLYVLTQETTGLQLSRYSTSDGASKLLVENFEPVQSGEITGLIYSSDGNLHQYAIGSDGVIYGSRYNILKAEFTTEAILKPKTSATLRMTEQPVSPDGTFLLLEYSLDNQENYELVALNSRTSSTIYATSSLHSQAWLPNSLSVSFINQDNTLVKLEVGPHTSEELTGVSDLQSIAYMRWIDVHNILARANDGPAYLIHESGEKTVLFDGRPVQALAAGKVKIESD